MPWLHCGRRLWCRAPCSRYSRLSQGQAVIRPAERKTRKEAGHVHQGVRLSTSQPLIMDSVELLFEVHAEELLHRDWDILKQVGLPSQARHTADSNRPHITLLAAPRIPPGYDGALAALAELLPLPIHTTGLVLFGSGRGQVLARLGVVGEALLELHRMVHRALGEVPDVAANCIPDRWVPHVTIARRLNPVQVAQALELLPGDHGQLQLTTLRRWDSHEKTTTALGSG